VAAKSESDIENSAVDKAEPAQSESSKGIAAVALAAKSTRVESHNGEPETENRIAPPELMQSIEHEVEHDVGKNGAKSAAYSTTAVKSASSSPAVPPKAADAPSIGKSMDDAPADEVTPDAVDVDAATAEKQA
jgi:hypothetical protein